MRERVALSTGMGGRELEGTELGKRDGLPRPGPRRGNTSPQQPKKLPLPGWASPIPRSAVTGEPARCLGPALSPAPLDSEGHSSWDELISGIVAHFGLFKGLKVPVATSCSKGFSDSNTFPFLAPHWK